MKGLHKAAPKGKLSLFSTTKFRDFSQKKALTQNKTIPKIVTNSISILATLLELPISRILRRVRILDLINKGTASDDAIIAVCTVPSLKHSSGQWSGVLMG
jgi:hypothetical protein